MIRNNQCYEYIIRNILNFIDSVYASRKVNFITEDTFHINKNNKSTKIKAMFNNNGIFITFVAHQED